MPEWRPGAGVPFVPDCVHHDLHEYISYCCHSAIEHQLFREFFLFVEISFSTSFDCVGFCFMGNKLESSDVYRMYNPQTSLDRCVHAEKHCPGTGVQPNLAHVILICLQQNHQPRPTKA